MISPGWDAGSRAGACRRCFGVQIIVVLNTRDSLPPDNEAVVANRVAIAFRAGRSPPPSVAVHDVSEAAFALSAPATSLIQAHASLLH